MRYYLTSPLIWQNDEWAVAKKVQISKVMFGQAIWAKTEAQDEKTAKKNLKRVYEADKALRAILHRYDMRVLYND